MTPEEIKANIKALKAEWKEGDKEEGARENITELYIGGLYVGEIIKLYDREEWRALFASTPHGEETSESSFLSEKEAKESVEKALLDALSICWTGEEDKE